VVITGEFVTVSPVTAHPSTNNSSSDTPSPSVFTPLMPSSSIISANGAVTIRDFDLEERKALLASDSGEPDDHNLEDIQDKHGWSSTKIALTALVLIILLIMGAFAFMVLCGYPGQKRHPTASSVLRSNGTHEFKPTVLIVSIDGLRCVLLSIYEVDVCKLKCYYNRADYLDRGLTPHLLALSKKGLRAKSMKPIFPVCWHLFISSRSVL
jgi:hypothetical protein